MAVSLVENNFSFMRSHEKLPALIIENCNASKNLFKYLFPKYMILCS